MNGQEFADGLVREIFWGFAILFSVVALCLFLFAWIIGATVPDLLKGVFG